MSTNHFYYFLGILLEFLNANTSKCNYGKVFISFLGGKDSLPLAPGCQMPCHSHLPLAVISTVATLLRGIKKKKLRHSFGKYQWPCLDGAPVLGTVEAVVPAASPVLLGSDALLFLEEEFLLIFFSIIHFSLYFSFPLWFVTGYGK